MNLTIPQNKLIDFPNLTSSSYGSLIIGKSINILQKYHFLGVDPARGVYIFADYQGNPVFSPNFSTDRIVTINPDPKFYGSIQNSFGYKGLQLDIFFQFVKQIGRSPLPFMLPGARANQPVSVVNRWQKPGDINTYYQRYNSNNSLSLINASSSSDGFYLDASYIRLKNISLSYELPSIWKKKTQLQNCRLYIQGQNLLTLTHFPNGVDPETKGNTTLPPLKVLTVGLQVGL